MLHGHSGSGKSTLLRSLYATLSAGQRPYPYPPRRRMGGHWSPPPHARCWKCAKTTIGWVSQFLQVIPAHFCAGGGDAAAARSWDAARSERREAAQLLTRLNVPERLWHLAPSTFSGGEQQRVNIARGFAVDYPILLLDEPTASLDGKKQCCRGQPDPRCQSARRAAIVGIFHDEGVRRQVADRLHSMGMTA